MSGRRLACIVEGHADADALPVLLRRIAARIAPAAGVDFLVAAREPRHRVVRPGELERVVELAARRAPGAALLVLLDADDDCPAVLGPKLLARACAARGDRPIAVVLACREFESWFLAAAASLCGVRGLRAQVEAPAQFEQIRGAKEWLTRHMEPGRAYSETADQAALAARLDLDAARRSPSFDKLWREVERLLGSEPGKAA